ncbi:MAG: DUF4250 family protein [Oscillospiraceae bacterium]|nr:DUF4250 family protein [Oscillospiraceae bacterium]
MCRLIKIMAVSVLVSLMLCSCSEMGDDPGSSAMYAAVTADTVPKEPETVMPVSEASETETVTSVSETETIQTETVTEKTAAAAYDMPEEFYIKLDELTQKYPHYNMYDVSLAYTDFGTGFTFMINPDKHYFSASVMKAPYMMYIYRLALDGKADLGQKLVYTQNFFREGTGVLKDMEFGTEFTVEELIGYALEESDNAAFAMLRALYPEDGYTEFMESLGITHDEDSRAFNQPQICCESSLILTRSVYDFITEGNKYSENLEYHMTHSRNALILGGEGSEVVRKYGWYEGYLHDMAVVLCENDYGLTIMTNFDKLPVNTREYRFFWDLSSLIAEFSGQLTESEENQDNEVIIYIERPEVKEMALPKDPYMLLSVVNMKLRDQYGNLDALCDDMEAVPADISAALEGVGYQYDAGSNQFVPIPEEEESQQEES